MDREASRVIIVDDMVINRMIISSLLASNGVLADQAESGRECIEMCRDKEYDLILLDHRMPEYDGVDTLLELKELFKEQGREVPVVCHTTEEGRSNINLYKSAGFADVLIKPIDPKELSEVIMTYLPEEDILAQEEIEKTSEPSEEFTNEEISHDVQEELDKLPLWLKTVPHIDLVKGVTNCSCAEDYIDALYVFSMSINSKSEDILYYMRDREWTMYRLSVHSLKSMARLIGARDLAALAKELEDACEENDYKLIKEKTPMLLESYRKFKELLGPLMEDEDIMALINEAEAEEKERRKQEEKEEVLSYSRTKSVLYIRPNHGIVTKGVEKNLKDANFNVISVVDEPDEIIAHRQDADIVLYHPIAEGESHIGITMNMLNEMCRDDSKIFLLMGDVSDLEIAREAGVASIVSRIYERPVDMNKFIDDILYYSELLEENQRKKTLFVVDDDSDYLAVVNRWLSKNYLISTFSSGEELINGLNTARPDLILMDYEMPDLDGYDLLKKIRTKDETKDIPVIFLTGKNDRDHVYKILNYKPDGYLLKTSQKEDLLDVIDRFFAEMMYRKSLEEVERDDNTANS